MNHDFKISLTNNFLIKFSNLVWLWIYDFPDGELKISFWNFWVLISLTRSRDFWRTFRNLFKKNFMIFISKASDLFQAFFCQNFLDKNLKDSLMKFSRLIWPCNHEFLSKNFWSSFVITLIRIWPEFSDFFDFLVEYFNISLIWAYSIPSLIIIARIYDF